LLIACLLFALAGLLPGSALAQSPGTAFTYQGQLRTSGGQAITDNCDFTFALFNAASGGAQVGSPLNKNAVAVTDGLFSVSLDFGSSAYDGNSRWLEIGVRCPARSGSFVTLSPRRAIQSVPYAMRAGSAASVAWSDISGVPSTIANGDNQTLSLSGPTLSISGGNSVSLRVLGTNSSAAGTNATVSGGQSNTASGPNATIGGGAANTATNKNTTVAGGYGNDATGDSAAIGGGAVNTATNKYSSVAGGFGNDATGDSAGIGGGALNTATDFYAWIGGGNANTASGARSTVSGGQSNTASGEGSTIGGGGYNGAISGNQAKAPASTIGGGYGNTIEAAASYATVSGGHSNTASGLYAVVPGGLSNTASGKYSFAAGRKASATHDGSFVWADGADVALASSATNQFSARAKGGFRFLTNTAHTTGCSLSAGGGSWNCTSDRNMKEQIEAVDPVAVLEAVADLPISTWNYTTQDQGIRHMGPMAQDFAAAFGLGEDDISISMVDADGVSLAAIQGLYRQNQEQAQIIRAQQETIAAQNALLEELLRRVEALEAGNE